MSRRIIMVKAPKPAANRSNVPAKAGKANSKAVATIPECNGDAITLSPLSEDSRAQKFFWEGECFLTHSTDVDEIAEAINNREYYRTYSVNADTGEKVWKNSFRVLWSPNGQNLSIMANSKVLDPGAERRRMSDMTDEDFAALAEEFAL